MSSCLQAFVLDEGCTVPSPFELTHYCLLPVPTQNWLNFFPDNSSFSVYTNNTELIGKKTVLVVQVFKHFPEVLPYVKFNIELKQKVTIHFMAPYFYPDLQTEFELFIGEAWQYSLPSYFDP